MRREVKRRKAVVIVKNPEVIRLLADFTRTEILRLLSRKSMTETQLSKELGITKAAVGYHLHLLMKAGLIDISRTEAEKHGILQKYYTTVASLFIVDPEKIPEDAKRYFLQVQIEHLMGILSVFKLRHQLLQISSEKLEELAKVMLEQLKIVGQRYIDQEAETGDSESLEIKIYAEALARLTKQREWRNIFKR
ncbi:winged helix-turn-helix transcriptional regulator [Candidatus Bathyarchaeota archaeon]|nr:winged helix-turn-helix transcriptional regulator [Candidatus Bathyarchaeota archaeon]